MLYPFMTLNDNTEIVHSEILENSGKEEVEVRIEKPVQGGASDRFKELQDCVIHTRDLLKRK